MSSSHMNVYSGDPQVTASLVGVTSSSCPADLTQKRELTGTSLARLPRPCRVGCVWGVLVCSSTSLECSWGEIQPCPLWVT